MGLEELPVTGPGLGQPPLCASLTCWLVKGTADGNDADHGRQWPKIYTCWRTVWGDPSQNQSGEGRKEANDCDLEASGPSDEMSWAVSVKAPWRGNSGGARCLLGPGGENWGLSAV